MFSAGISQWLGMCAVTFGQRHLLSTSRLRNGELYNSSRGGVWKPNSIFVWMLAATWLAVISCSRYCRADLCVVRSMEFAKGGSLQALRCNEDLWHLRFVATRSRLVDPSASGEQGRRHLFGHCTTAQSDAMPEKSLHYQSSSTEADEGHRHLIPRPRRSPLTTSFTCKHCAATNTRDSLMRHRGSRMTSPWTHVLCPCVPTKCLAHASPHLKLVQQVRGSCMYHILSNLSTELLTCAPESTVITCARRAQRRLKTQRKGNT